jgi:hypothetical protein
MSVAEHGRNGFVAIAFANCNHHGVLVGRQAEGAYFGFHRTTIVPDGTPRSQRRARLVGCQLTRPNWYVWGRRTLPQSE